MDYKTFFICTELLSNILFPAFLLKLEAYILIPYGLSIATPSLCLLYIYIMKRWYLKQFLCRTYVPGMGLIVVVETIDLVLIGLQYIMIFKDDLAWTWRLIIPATHILMTVGIYGLLLLQKVRNKAVIAYTRHEYKLGIISKDIGGEKGLKKGQPVEIVREVAEGYIVKDSSKNDYIVKSDDIESIINIV